MTGGIKGEMKTAKPFVDGASAALMGEMGHFCSKTLKNNIAGSFRQAKLLG